MHRLRRASLFAASCSLIVVPGQIAAQTPLPNLPDRPSEAILGEVPSCQTDYLDLSSRRARADRMLACLTELATYSSTRLQLYASGMAAYRNQLISLFNRVNTDGQYTYNQRKALHTSVTAELDKANPAGAYMVPYVVREATYRARYEALRYTYCATVTCTPPQP